MSTFHRPRTLIHAFLDLTQTLPSRFVRSRVWCPRSVMTWLLLVTLPDRKTCYRRSLRSLTFFGRHCFGWAKVPTLASISVARRKLSVPMCRSFLHDIVRTCEAIMPVPTHRWGTRRFIAFDGSRLVTPRTGDTARKLHRFHRPDGSRVHNPQGLLVAAVDVFRRLPLDWIFTGKGVGEQTSMRELVARMLWQPGDVAVMDRGFCSKKLFAALIERGVDIIVRMSTSDAIAWREVQDFLASKQKTGTVTMTLPGAKAPITVRLRLVERDRKRGRPRKGCTPDRMVILTTLSEEEGFDRPALISLYAARWGIESLFAEMKSFMEVESFHSGFVAGCEQEIAAAMIWMALGSLLQAEAERTLPNGRRVIRADCLRAASDLVSMLLQGHAIDQQIHDDLEALRQFAYLPKPGRHYPRECKSPHGRSIQRRAVK